MESVIFGIAEVQANNNSIITSDNNNFYNLISQGGNVFKRGNIGKTYTQWQALGFDTNSVTSNPLLDINFKPTTYSSTKDAGVTLIDFTTDKDGISRPQGSAWDIGAYEYIQAPPPLKGDFNTNGKVDIEDFTSFKNAFKSIFNSIFDLNSDNTIDVKDLGVLMSGWLE